MREHRKRQKVPAASDSAADEEGAPEGAGTDLATQSTGIGLVFGSTVLPKNAHLYSSCVQKALTDPLRVDVLAGFPELTMAKQRDLLFQCKQKVPFQHLMYVFGTLPVC